MSYFSEIYGDPELSAKAKLVLLYLGRVKIFSHFSLQALA